jgi:hypothetical protein
MNLAIPTPTLQSWQIAGWIDQAYGVISCVKDFEGVIIGVSPGEITIDNDERVIIVKEIPTQRARLEDPWIVLE